MLMLDLFSGLKGASAAMARRGWNVVTVDVLQTLRPTFVADLRGWSWGGPRPDLVWASPPCQEFSRHSMPWTRKRNPPPPDLSLVEAARRVIRETSPRWWVIENVKMASRWLGKPVMTLGAYRLWGEFPAFKAVVTKRKESLPGWMRQERARVSYAISLALCLACEAEATRHGEVG